MSRYRVRGDHIIHRLIDDEIILVDLHSGIYYSTRNSGSEIWQLVVAGATLSQILEALVARYGASADSLEPSVVRFVQRLVDEGLVESVTNPTSVTPRLEIDWSNVTTFAAPELECYSDMQDLLLVDPIHDVDEAGWPHPKVG